MLPRLTITLVQCTVTQVILKKQRNITNGHWKLKKKQLGANHVGVARSYNNLGTVNSDTGDLEKAKEYHEWALKRRKEQLGANHVHVAMSYNNLGNVYSKTGDLEKAKISRMGTENSKRTIRCKLC